MEYNARFREYDTGSQVTLYKRTITNGSKREGLNKANKREERTEAEEAHCRAQSAKVSKDMIYNIARSNTWEYFITLTFDREKVKADNYDIVTRKLQKFLCHLRERKCKNLKYLIVPELHKDGKHYHFHGLLANCDGVIFDDSGLRTKDGLTIYNIRDWHVGFTTATKVKDTQKVCSYIAKYITKALTMSLPNKKRYYASQNLKRPEETYGVIEQEEFMKLYGDRIKHIKSVEIPEAHQIVTYVELDD